MSGIDGGTSAPSVPPAAMQPLVMTGE